MNQKTIRALMEEKARAVQAVVTDISSFDEAAAYTIQRTRDQEIKTVAAPALHPDLTDRLKKECESAGITFLESPLTKNTGHIATSLTFADWGIAETGTLVLKSDSESLRIATMLADTHIAILKASTIVPDATSIAADLNEILLDTSPSYTAFITGASRTADIERVLAIGVHGPQELHILILKEG